MRFVNPLFSIGAFLLATTSTVHAQATPHDCFTLTLNKVTEGSPSVTSLTCQFSYTWDYDTNMGYADLQQVNDALVSVTLNPLGIMGYLDFMSDGSVNATVSGVELSLDAVILDQANTTNRMAYLRFTENGAQSALATQNWSDE